jgi:hypothetical protein
MLVYLIQLLNLKKGYMKTNIKVKEIADPNTNVCVNSAEHKIAEIKEEIRECFACGECNKCQTEVIDMCKED